MAGPDSSWWAVARRPAVVRRAAKIALVVGTLLTAINQGDRLLAGDVDLALGVKLLLTYCVPYCVSTVSSVGAIRDAARSDDSRA